MLNALFSSESKYGVDEENDSVDNGGPSFQHSISRHLSFEDFRSAGEVVVGDETSAQE